MTDFDGPPGRVAGIRRAVAEGEPMTATDEVEAVPGGLAGDRYLTGDGYYSPFDVCEVTFIASEALTAIRESRGIDLTDGRHRRNVVTEGVPLQDLLGARFRVGDATLEGTRPRPPCAHVEAAAGEEGVARALGDGRGGICADVIDAGTLAVGDRIELLADRSLDPDDLAAAIRDRVDGT